MKLNTTYGLIVLAVVLLAAAGIYFFSAENSDRQEDTAEETLHSLASIDRNQTTVYYFHSNRRCTTCQAVESVTQEALTELYDSKISFISVNVEQSAGQELADSFGVTGSSLVIAKGEQIIDITSEAFMNAVNRPERLKEKIKETVDSLM